MAITARDMLKRAYPFLWQYWATHAIWSDNFLSLLNMALDMIRVYRWREWSWSHWKDNFTSLQDDPYRLVTTHPVKRVHSFYSWTMIKRDWFEENTLCDCDIPQDVNTPCTLCNCNGCKPLKLELASPQSQLCPWYYQVSWWEYEWMWWLFWRIIRVKMHNKLSDSEWLWVTYVRSNPTIEKFDDIVPIPTAFATPVAMYIAVLALPRYGQFRWWEELNLFQIANNHLNDLQEADKNFPQKMVFEEDMTTSAAQGASNISFTANY